MTDESGPFSFCIISALSVLFFGFMFFGYLSYSVFTAIPSLLFVSLLLIDRPFVKNWFLAYRWGWGPILVVLVVAIFLSQLPVRSLKGVYDFVRGALVVVPVTWLVQRHGVRFQRILTWVAILSALLLVGVSAFALSQGGAVEQRAVFDRWFGQYNVYGHGVGIMFVTMSCMCLFKWRENRLASGFLLLLSLVLLGTVFLSGSRGSLLACILSVFVMLSLYRPQYSLRFLGAGFVFTGSGLYFLKEFAAGKITMWERGGDISAGRFEIYQVFLQTWWDNARAFGFGPNTYKYLDIGHTSAGSIPMPHNVLFELLGSMGLAGSLVFLLGFLFFLSRVSWLRVGEDLVGLLGASILFYALVRGMFDLKLWGAYYPGLVMLALGLASSSKSRPGDSDLKG